MQDQAEINDAFHVAMQMAKVAHDHERMYGYGVITLHDGDGRLKEVEPFHNRITTQGDEFYAKRGAAGIGTPNLAQPTLVNGMKLGTGATAASKSGAGSTLGTYITGSNKVFDTTHPALVDEAGDTGWSIEWKVTWAAGQATNSAITEAVIVEDANVDDATSAFTISRIVFTAKNKTADDTLAITWKHTFNAA